MIDIYCTRNYQVILYLISVAEHCPNITDITRHNAFKLKKHAKNFMCIVMRIVMHIVMCMSQHQHIEYLKVQNVFLPS